MESSELLGIFNYEVLIALLFSSAVWLLFFSLLSLSKDKCTLEKTQIITNVIIAFILSFTGIVIAKQAMETNRAVNYQKYNIEIQNQPYIDLSEFRYRYGKGAFHIEGTLRCYGTTAAHDFERIRDWIICIETSESKREKFKKKKNDVEEKTEYFFYLKDIVDEISNFIRSNPKITKADLKEYLKKIRDNPLKVKHEAGHGFELTLDFISFYIYKEINEWRKFVTVIPPQKDIPFNTTRVTGDLIPSIKNNKKILIYYCSTRYEGLAKGRELTSHYIGRLFKSPFSYLGPDLPAYPLEEVKTWTSRKPMPK